MWEDFVHLIRDIFYLIQWIFDNLQSLFSVLISPLTWIFNFSKGFLIGINSIPEEITIPVLPSGVFTIFQSIPYFNYLIIGVSVGLGILFVSFIFRRIVHI